MPSQQIVWTALPNGLAGDSANRVLKLSAFVSPRLAFDGGQTTGELQSFPEFLSWPDRLRSADFSIKVRFGGGAELDARILTKPLLDTVLWRAVFGPSTFVRARGPAPSTTRFRSFPAGAMNARLAGGYATLVEKSPFQPACNATLAAAFPELHSAMRAADPASAAVMRSRVSGAGAISEAELHALRKDLVADLLRPDPHQSLADKVAAAGELSERLARSPSVSGAIAVIPETDDPASVFAQFAAFHQARRPAQKTAASADGALARAADRDRMDFHQLLSALAEYPQLLRRLGIVVDLEIDARGVPPSLSGNLKTLSVVPTARASMRDVSAETKYLFDLQPAADSRLPIAHFLAAPLAWRDATPVAPPAGREMAEIVGGLLNLSLPREDLLDTFQFDLLQIDVDGAGSKLLNVMNTVAGELDGAAPVDGRRETGTPTLRTSGISLVRARQAARTLGELPTTAGRDAALRRGAAPVFFAEDLVRGYRIDVRRFPANHQVGTPVPLSAVWLSLHKRIGRFTLGSGAAAVTLPDIAEEGFVQPVIVQHEAGGADGSAHVQMHESMSNWRCWSLAAPPPMEVTSGLLQLAPGAAMGVPALPEASIVFEAEPGTLPRLRFGHYYQFRARTVDLAGNGLGLFEADEIVDTLERHRRRLPILFEKAEDFFRYRRFEPVDAPAVVLREALREGEGEGILVIRSMGAPQGPGEAPFPVAKFNSEAERHIVPPKVAPEMVEAHGLLDDAFGPGGNPRAGFNICQKRDGRLSDPFVFDIRTGRREALPDAMAEDPATGSPVRIPNGIRFVRIGGEGSLDGYTIHYEQQLRLPYLPDPIARGAALFNLPGVISESGHLEGDTIIWEDSTTQFLPDDAIKKLGCVTKIGFGGRSEWHDRLPFRLRLAALAPEVRPERPGWTADRVLTVKLPQAERSTIWISSYPDRDDLPILGVHNWSLARVGHQTDSQHFINTAPHGALSMLSPARKLELVHAVQRPVHRPTEISLGTFRALRLGADETVAYVRGKFKVHVKSTAKLDLLASWKERGPGGVGLQALTTHVFDFQLPLDGAAPVVPSGQIPAYEQIGDTVTLRAPADLATARASRHLARHEFGDTKYRRVTYRLIATSRFRDYFPKEVAENDHAVSCFFETTVDVDSSARPAPVEIDYIVPAFQWETLEDDGMVEESRRRGGGLRVYLGASWHSSGDGEQLAVLDASRALWGVDPIHHAPGAALGTMTPSVEAVTVPGAPGIKVYPYDVAFDEVAGRWYCDLSFNTQGNYFPFVALTLARYQRHSLDGMHLSAPHYAGFHQLAPDRGLTIQRTPGVSGEVTITISGARPSAAQVAGLHIGLSFDLALEERDRAREDWDETLGWQRGRDPEQPIAGTAAGPEQLWRGTMRLRPRDPNRQRRLVIREFELFSHNEAPPGQAWLGDVSPDDGRFSRRLVYADIISID